MRLGRLNHIGVAVPDIDRAVGFYREVLGARLISDAVVLEAQQVQVCFVATPGGGGDGGGGGTQIELLAPIGLASPVGRWLARHPQGGQHHLCYEVPDIAAALAWFTGLGRRVLGPPRIGAHGTPIFFVHPADMGGVLTEIMETPAGPAHGH